MSKMECSNNGGSMNCPVCEKRADKICSGCRSVSYCCTEHQKQDWKEHKKSCRIYVIKKNEILGRYMVAARDIPAGTIVLNEAPLAYGPKQDTKPLCLGCHKFLSDITYKCSKCQFPLCGPPCEEVPVHAENECQLFQRSKWGVKISDLVSCHPVYECILTVRCLLLKDHQPKKWEALIQMEHHNDIRKTMKELWHRNQVNTVQFLRERHTMTEFNEYTIHSVLGYADVNSFELRTNDIEICGLYANIYLMAHDCISNTHHTITDDFSMIVRSVVPIKKGELITTTYSHTLEGTLERRQYIQESKFFDCTCKRCSDPTEMGTYFSSIRCQHMKNNNPNSWCSGYLTSENSLDNLSVWKCDKCKNSMTVQNVQDLLSKIKEEADEIKEGDNLIPRLEALLKKHSGKSVHPNHYLMINIIHSLSQLYGRTTGWHIDDLDMDLLKRKEKHCRDLLKVLDVLEAGLSRIRGVTLYELHAAIYFVSQREFNDNLINADQLKSKFEEVLRLLNESQNILLFDAPSTSEGSIALSISESITRVNQVMKHFCT